MLFNVLPCLWKQTASKAYSHSHFHSLLNGCHHSVFGCFSYWAFLFRLMLSALPSEMLIRLSSYEIRKLSSYFDDVRNRHFCPETINAASRHHIDCHIHNASYSVYGIKCTHLSICSEPNTPLPIFTPLIRGFSLESSVYGGQSRVATPTESDRPRQKGITKQMPLTQ